MIHTIALFDIDNTLIRARIGHVPAFSYAIKKVYGIETSIDIINHHGMTDKQIVVEVLKKHSVKKETILAGLERCANEMASYYKKIVKQDEIEVLPGVFAFLDKLAKHHVLLGVVTGNLEPIAWLKLKKANLSRYFRWGAFGSDRLDRQKLIELALDRIQPFAGRIFRKRVFLFGDTVKDVQAGRAARINIIGVATGIYSTKELLNAGATFAVESLVQVASILDVMHV